MHLGNSRATSLHATYLLLSHIYLDNTHLCKNLKLLKTMYLPLSRRLSVDNTTKLVWTRYVVKKGVMFGLF